MNNGDKILADRGYLISKGFTENKYSFEKGEFSLMKTTLGIWYEIVYKHKIREKITATIENVESHYEKYTGKTLTNE